MKSNIKLTVIIPFLNEKYEVENTIKSIIANSENNVHIILINDSSDDSFDYEFLEEKYALTYIFNKERLGVAASRDLGIEICTTPYFLLLDSHMRFYNKIWIDRIVSELENDKSSLLCCQTKELFLENGMLMENDGRPLSYGACIDFKTAKKFNETYWIFTDQSKKEENTFDIPCILGAGYACSKKYWKYIKGLKGLISYGSDEAYISMKVWLEGGSCKLLKDVTIGHIYRPSAPYKVISFSNLYNRMLIATTLEPKLTTNKVLSELKLLHPKKLAEVLYELYNNRTEIQELKEYYNRIFTKDFSFFEKINFYPILDKKIVCLDETLSLITEKILKKVSSLDEVGLIYGKMGIVIFLFYYSHYSKNNYYKKQANILLEEIIENISTSISISFADGLWGIGWALDFLYENGFITGNIDEILEDFDKKAIEYNFSEDSSINLDYGLGGLILYLLARIYTVEKKQIEFPFSTDFLMKTYETTKTILETRDLSCDCVDIYIDFINYMELKSIDAPSLYKINSLINPRNIPLQELEMGLRGIAGIGLKIILDNKQ